MPAYGVLFIEQFQVRREAGGEPGKAARRRRAGLRFLCGRCIGESAGKEKRNIPGPLK